MALLRLSSSRNYFRAKVFNNFNNQLLLLSSSPYSAIPSRPFSSTSSSSNPRNNQNQNKLDFYQILNVPKSATTKDIKKAFRQKSLECHPDKYPDDPKKEASFKALSEAYQTLSDSDLRRKYDRVKLLNKSGQSQGPTKTSYSYTSKGQHQSPDDFFNSKSGFHSTRTGQRSSSYTKTENDIFGRRDTYYRHQRPEQNSNGRWTYTYTYTNNSHQGYNRRGGNSGQRPSPTSNNKRTDFYSSNEPNGSDEYHAQQGRANLRALAVWLVILYILINVFANKESLLERRMREYEREMSWRQKIDQERFDTPQYPYGYNGGNRPLYAERLERRPINDRGPKAEPDKPPPT